MREAVRIRVSAEQYQALRQVLAGVDDSSPLGLLIAEMNASFGESDVECLIHRAQEEYGSDDVEIDDDAAVSHADDGTWVGAWVWLRNEDGDDDEPDDADWQIDKAKANGEEIDKGVARTVLGSGNRKVQPIPADFPVQPLTPEQISEACSECRRSVNDRGDGHCERHGKPIRDVTTCGHCGLSWDDNKPTEYTPAPSARCPFEYFHVGD